MKARLSEKTQIHRLSGLRERFGITPGEAGRGMSVIKPPQRADAAIRTNWAIEVIRRWKVGVESGVTAIHPTEEIYCLSRAAWGTAYRMDTPEAQQRAAAATRETYRLRKLANPPKPKVQRPMGRPPGPGKTGKASHSDRIYDVKKRQALLRKMGIRVRAA